MLTKKQISQIKEHLDKAQNPIFFFDNDADGLCSFLLLKKWTEKGKGVAVRSYPDMDSRYFRKVLELKADYIFILDKPVVSNDFFEEARKNNIPIVWIDHHAVQGKIPDFVNYYNVMLNKPKTNEPVTALCYQITKRKEDLWLNIVGCISDKFVPKSYAEFQKKYSELSVDTKDAFDILYGSEIGKIARMFNFGLKDSITNVIRMQKFLIKAKGPYDVLEETTENKNLHDKFNQIGKKGRKMIKEALKEVSEQKKIIFFQYAGETSMSSDISNELSYRFPDKYIVIMRINAGIVSISCRGENIRKYLLRAIKNLKDATGGGHRDAVGARINIKDLEKFKEDLGYIIENRKV